MIILRNGKLCITWDDVPYNCDYNEPDDDTRYATNCPKCGLRLAADYCPGCGWYAKTSGTTIVR